MILGEKTGREHSSNHMQKWPESTAVKDANSSTFSDVVNSACKKLMDRQIKFSIQRIIKMEEQLSCMEQELDAFLCLKNKE